MAKGIIYSNGGSLIDTNSIYKYNAAIYGGAYNLEDTKATIVNSSVSNNYVKYGGAFYIVDKSDVDIKNSVFRNNFATIRGGTMMIQQ